MRSGGRTVCDSRRVSRLGKRRTARACQSRPRRLGLQAGPTDRRATRLETGPAIVPSMTTARPTPSACCAPGATSARSRRRISPSLPERRSRSRAPRSGVSSGALAIAGPDAGDPVAAHASIFAVPSRAACAPGATSSRCRAGGAAPVPDRSCSSAMSAARWSATHGCCCTSCTRSVGATAVPRRSCSPPSSRASPRTFAGDDWMRRSWPYHGRSLVGRAARGPAMR